jgi:hypothetical protein
LPGRQVGAVRHGHGYATSASRTGTRSLNSGGPTSRPDGRLEAQERYGDEVERSETSVPALILRLPE